MIALSLFITSDILEHGGFCTTFRRGLPPLSGGNPSRLSGLLPDSPAAGSNWSLRVGNSKASKWTMSQSIPRLSTP